MAQYQKLSKLSNKFPSKILRSSNPFFIFLQEFRHELKAKRNESINPRQVTQMAGEKWRQMSNNDKLIYFVWARKNQQQKKNPLKPQNRVKRKKLKYNTKSVPSHHSTYNYIN